MIIIRRATSSQQSYTLIMLPPDVHQMIPTTDQEHADILKIYKQDKPYPEIINDFSEFKIGQDQQAS